MPEFGPAVRAYRRELLRWNEQINLVSRRNTEQIVDHLLDQCQAGIGALMSDREMGWGGLSRLLYGDLGSGGGLPGAVWHASLVAVVPRLTSVLVEPRVKRAWFLERLPAIMDLPAWRVSRGRWGAVEAQDPEPSYDGVLLSLKALRLSDDEVLDGLCAYARGALPVREGGVITIATYLPREPGSSISPDPAAETTGAVRSLFGRSVAAAGVRFLATPGLSASDARLRLSAYRALD